MTPERDWMMLDLIRTPKRQPAPEAPAAFNAKAAGKRCLACGTALYDTSKTGLCRKHVHAPGLCGCAQCRRLA